VWYVLPAALPAPLSAREKDRGSSVLRYVNTEHDEAFFPNQKDKQYGIHYARQLSLFGASSWQKPSGEFAGRGWLEMESLGESGDKVRTGHIQPAAISAPSQSVTAFPATWKLKIVSRLWGIIWLRSFALLC